MPKEILFRKQPNYGYFRILSVFAMLDQFRGIRINLVNKVDGVCLLAILLAIRGGVYMISPLENILYHETWYFLRENFRMESDTPLPAP